MYFSTTSFALSLVALALSATSTFASPRESYPGMTPDGVIWKRYEPKMLSTGPPPPPHPAELEPRSIHRSKPSRYHVASKGGDTPGEGGKRRLMNYKQVTAREVKKRALEKTAQPQGRNKKVYFDVNNKKKDAEKRANEAAAAAQDEEEGSDAIEGWSWVDDDELVAVKNDSSLSWAQKMEVRMRKTKPLFATATPN